jgi:hypothetical protein
MGKIRIGITLAEFYRLYPGTTSHHSPWVKFPYFELNEKEAKYCRCFWDYKSRKVCWEIDHNECDFIQYGVEPPIYCPTVARRRYPFLFVDTNPLLWRKFYA